MNRKAFTLIELLIVVAIIAILAAIAVPNFLEAQTRSKMSRAKADMRSIVTAIEAYAVDYNKYPPRQYCGQLVFRLLGCLNTRGIHHFRSSRYLQDYEQA
jgi:prepilin-type N-terminal cleavage/methylation domain-containing protein